MILLEDRKKRIFGLDLLRAIAILLILCSHSVVLLAPNNESWLAFGIKFFGTLGVDVFFVLSGFLIGGILLNHIILKQTNFKSILYFWIRRWFRTLPNYYLILVINILLLFLFNRQRNFEIWSYFLFLQNFNSSQPDFFTESWSLSIEEFAYILLPLLLILCLIIKLKITTRTFLWLSVLCIAIVTINRMYFNAFLVESSMEWSGSLRKVVVYRLDSIYYGFLGAFVFKCYISIWKNFKYTFAFSGATIFISSHFYIYWFNLVPDVENTFFNICYLPLVSISIILCFPLVYSLELKGVIKRIITKVSLWSYSLYLVNFSIVLLSLDYFFQIEDFSIAQKSLLLIGFWLISFFLAFLLYTFYEIPMMSLRDSNFFKKKIFC